MRINITCKSMTAGIGTILCALALLLPGCGPKSDSGLLGALGLAGGGDRGGSALISAATGGVVQLNDELKLTVPAEALADDLTISIEHARSIPAGDAGGLVPFGQAYRFLPGGTGFDLGEPAVLEMYYDSAELARLGLSPETIQICYYDEKLKCYVPVNTTVDTSLKKATALIEHFTVYLPMAQALLPTNNRPYVGLQAPWPSTIRADAPIYIRATVRDYDGRVAGVKLSYRKLQPVPGAWIEARMTREVNPLNVPDTYGYLVPASFLTAADLGAGNDIEYTVEAMDNLGAVRTTGVRRYDVTAVYQAGSLNISPVSVEITAGFERLMYIRALDNNDAAFTLVPETFAMTGGSCALVNRFAQGIVLKGVTRTPAGSPDQFTVGFAGESVAVSATVHAGEIESIEIRDTNGLPIAGDLGISEGTSYAFDVLGHDGYGNTIPVIPVWSADASVGVMSPDGALDTTGCHGPGVVTASLVYWTDTQNVYVQSRAKEITAFSINGVEGVIAFPFVTVTLPWGTDVTGLTAQFSTTGVSVTVDGDIQESGVTANDFTDPVVYRVTAEDGSSQDYTVRVRMLSPYKDITAFSISGANVTIIGTTITAYLPNGTDVTSLVASFTTTGHSVTVGGVVQESGVTANDFTNPISYTVTAEDSSAKEYTVTVAFGMDVQGLVSHLAGSLGGFGDTNGIGQEARFWNPTSVTSDGTNLYVADSANHTIRKIDISSREVTTFAGSHQDIGCSDGIGSAARFIYPTGITSDGTNLYVTERGGHTIRKIVIATQEVTTLAGLPYTSGSADGIGQNARFNNPSGITNDGMNLYVTDTLNHTIRKIEIISGTVTTIAGLPGTTGSSDGAGQNALFNNPQGITIDGSNLYIADSMNFTIRKLDLATEAVTTIAGTAGTGGSTNGIGQNALFGVVRGIDTDGANLYVTDMSYRTIRKIEISSMQVSTFAGRTGISGSSDGIGQNAQFNNPEGLFIEGNNLFLADGGNNTIRKILIDTAEVITIAGLAGSWGFSDGTGLDATFYYPKGITSDDSDLYITQMDTIRKINIITGQTTTIAGFPYSRTVTDGVGQNARFREPTGITCDGMNLFVSDSSTIRKIVISTSEVTTISGQAETPGSTDAPWLAARFNNPNGITIYGNTLYIADTGNHSIRKMVLDSGEVTTLAGLSGTSGSVDGTGEDARFKYPYGITTDGAYLFVTDLGNYTIRKICIDTGLVTTIAGLAGYSNSTDGIGDAARFRNPFGITNDGINLFVTDLSSLTVRMINITTAEVTTIAGLARNRGSADGYGSAARFNDSRGIVYVDGNLYIADTNNNCIRKIE